MPGASLLALLDDITAVLDDIATMTKLAARKTAGVLGDDLALNAHQLSGAAAERELPIVWAVAKGSLVNKAILVPGALALSAFAPWAVLPLLLAGGLYLCLEGAEKLVHAIRARFGDDVEVAPSAGELGEATRDPVAFERARIRGAVRTDFILSAEIIVITLGTVAASPFMTQVAVLVAVALAMTVFVYGLVAGIVKLDDAGLALMQRSGRSAWQRIQRATGRRIVGAAPSLMRTLSVVGTAAMFLVGGGIVVHAWPALDETIAAARATLGAIGAVGPALAGLAEPVLAAMVGLAAGLGILAVVEIGRRRRPT